MADPAIEGSPHDPEALPPKPEVDSATFAALDLRVGEVVDVVPFPEARRPAWKLAVDFGPHLGVRWTSAQIAEYAAEELRGRQVVAVTNLGRKRIAGFVSEFLVLGGLEPDGRVRLLAPDTTLPLGAPVA